MRFNYLDYTLLITVSQYRNEMLIARSKSKPDLKIAFESMWICGNTWECSHLIKQVWIFFFAQSTRSVNISKRETRSAKRNRTIMIGLATFLAIPLFPYIILNIRILYMFVPRLNVLWSNLDVSKMLDVRFRIWIIIFIKYNYYWLYYYNGIILLTYIRRNTYGFNEILS